MPDERKRESQTPDTRDCRPKSADRNRRRHCLPRTPRASAKSLANTTLLSSSTAIWLWLEPLVWVFAEGQVALCLAPALCSKLCSREPICSGRSRGRSAYSSPRLARSCSSVVSERLRLSYLDLWSGASAYDDALTVVAAAVHAQASIPQRELCTPSDVCSLRLVRRDLEAALAWDRGALELPRG
jgi:hypothetical protein